MSLPLENPPPPPCPQGKPPPENETFLISPSYSKLFPMIKIFCPPPNFSNSLDLLFMLISMSLCKFLLILERTVLHIAA